LDIVKKEVFELSTTYQNMFEKINKNFPIIAQATKNFNKTQSQFMDTMLTVSQPTALRSARQCLAEIEKSKQALVETSFKLRKNKIELEKSKSFLSTVENSYDKQLLEIEIQEKETGITQMMGYVEGAIRKVSNYIDQYLSIMSKIDISEMTEEDFEKDEERYHIMTAFTQGLCAARSHGGIIDEGNQIYFHQIGINGTQAQIETTKYLESEIDLLKQNKDIPHSMTIEWLDRMASKFAGCSKKYAESRNMILLNKETLHS
jgi:hypothetical protein